MGRLALILVVLASLTGCWHATVETGLTPSTVVLDKPWASSWIYGLVPPKTVETARRCPDGVAKVETELTFLNQLVHLLTFGIYTPMRIRVTCAQRSGASAGTKAAGLTVPAQPGMRAAQSVFSAAAERAVRRREAVLVFFEPDGAGGQ